jgi:hypothetical protein
VLLSRRAVQPAPAAGLTLTYLAWPTWRRSLFNFGELFARLASASFGLVCGCRVITGLWVALVICCAIGSTIVVLFNVAVMHSTGDTLGFLLRPDCFGASCCLQRRRSCSGRLCRPRTRSNRPSTPASETSASTSS